MLCVCVFDCLVSLRSFALRVFVCFVWSVCGLSRSFVSVLFVFVFSVCLCLFVLCECGVYVSCLVCLR